MRRRVVLSPVADRQAEQAATWWAEHRSAQQAARWLQAFEDSLNDLKDSAATCPLAYESGRFPTEVRQRLFGVKNKPTHRLVFVINGSDVTVFAVRHLAQDDLSPSDLPT